VLDLSVEKFDDIEGMPVVEGILIFFNVIHYTYMIL
jgi:hypothetical protein